MAPGAWELLQVLLTSWQPYTLLHAWQLPDGFEAKVKVMSQKDVRIEVDELDHAEFSYTFYENEGQRRGLSNVANVVHSIDAYVLRSVHRRCNYDAALVEQAHGTLKAEAYTRKLGGITRQNIDGGASEALQYYVGLYERTGMADVVILPHLLKGQVSYLSDEHIEALSRITGKMLEHVPFHVVTIH